MGCFVRGIFKRFTSDMDERLEAGAIQALVCVVATGGVLHLLWRHLFRQWEQEAEQREESDKILRRTERALKTISACNGVLLRSTKEAMRLTTTVAVASAGGTGNTANSPSLGSSAPKQPASLASVQFGSTEA